MSGPFKLFHLLCNLHTCSPSQCTTRSFTVDTLALLHSGHTHSPSQWTHTHTPSQCTLALLHSVHSHSFTVDTLTLLHSGHTHSPSQWTHSHSFTVDTLTLLRVVLCSQKCRNYQQLGSSHNYDTKQQNQIISHNCIPSWTVNRTCKKHIVYILRFADENHTNDR